MPIYRYVCAKKERCKLSALPKDFWDDESNILHVDLSDDRYVIIDENGHIDPDKSTIVQLVYHKMSENPNIKCLGCNGDTKRILGKMNFYFPGNCYLNKDDCKRQMLMHRLKENDPYAHIRPEGDKEALLDKLKRGNKAPPLHFYPGGKSGLKPSSPHRPGT